MKKLGLLCLLLAGMITAKAQPGSVLVYGDLNFHFYQDKGVNPERVQTGSIQPGIGIQVSNHFTVGVTGGYSIVSSKLDTGSTKRYNHSEWSAGAFVRYTSQLSRIFNFYTQLEGHYLFANDKYDSEPVTGTKYTGFDVKLTPAIGVNVKNGFALNFNFGGLAYRTIKYDGAPNSISNIDFTFGNQVSIGVSKNLGYSKISSRKHKKDKSTKDDE